MKFDKRRLQDLSPKDRREAEQAIEEILYKVSVNPLEGYFPHARQRIFHGMETPVKCFFGGTQSGKTTAGLADDLIQALPREALPEHLQSYKRFEPPFKARIMTESNVVLETVLYEKFRELCPERELNGGSWKTAYNRETKVLDFKCGSKFFFATYEQEVKKMGGITVDRVHYDEEPPIGHRTEGKFRVMRHGGDEIFTMTPTEGMTWTYDAIWENRGEEVSERVWLDPELGIILVDIDDNPAISSETRDRALAGLTKEERDARKSGKFVALHGLVYGEYSEARHVIPEMESLPENVNVVVGIDPGMRNRAGVLWTFVDHNDEMVVFDEGYYQGHTVAQVCKEIHLTNTRWNRKPVYYVIDPIARNLNHQTGRSDQMEYADHGVVAIAGQNALRPGINRVKERLEREGGLAVTANCRNLLSEMRKYRWKKPPRTGEDGKEETVKKDDHLLDPLRYVCMSRPYLPEALDTTSETQLERAIREDLERRSNQNPGRGLVGHAA